MFDDLFMNFALAYEMIKYLEDRGFTVEDMANMPFEEFRIYLDDYAKESLAKMNN